MIDEKKIEEAAKDYINKNDYFVKYDEDPCDDIEFAYKDAANWAINEFLKDLWHPASEEPEKFRKILFTGGSIDTTDTTMLIINNSWSTKVYLLEIKKWCYVDDLFPKKGGKK